MTRVWIALAVLYAAFVYWYGGWGAPLSGDELREVEARIEQQVTSPEMRARLLELARSDDGREFFMVNLNRYRTAPRYADGRDTGGAGAQEVESRYIGKMLPRLLSRACHPWVASEPIVELAGTPDALPLDRVTVVRYRSRRDFLDIVATSDWTEDAAHKWAALEAAHSYATRPAIALPGPRAFVLVLAAGLGVAIGAIQRWRQRRASR